MILFQTVPIIAGISLAFLSVFVSFSFMFAFIFIHRWAKEPIKRVSDTRLIWGFVIFALGLQQLFFLINDFFVATEVRSIWVYLGYGAVAVGMTLFVFIQEMTLNVKSHILTIINVILFLVLFLSPTGVQVFFALALVIFYATLLAIFTRYIIKIVSDRDKLYFSLFLAGVFLFVIGELFTSYVLVQQTVLFYPIGAFLLIAGTVLGNYGLYNLPSFTDIGWAKSIKEIYVIHESGVPILYGKFKSGTLNETKVGNRIFLASGLLSGLKLALRQVTQSRQNVLFVDQGDIKLIFGARKSILAVAVCERNYPTIYKRLYEFLREFTFMFADHIEDSAVDTAVFRPAYYLINKYFTS